MGDIIKVLSMRDQEVGTHQELASGHESTALQGNISMDLSMSM